MLAFNGMREGVGVFLGGEGEDKYVYVCVWGGGGGQKCKWKSCRFPVRVFFPCRMEPFRKEVYAGTKELVPKGANFQWKDGNGEGTRGWSKYKNGITSHLKTYVMIPHYNCIGKAVLVRVPSGHMA